MADDVRVGKDHADKEAQLSAEAFARNDSDRALAMEDLVGLVPVFLGACTEEVDVFERNRAFHFAELVVGGVGFHITGG